MFLCNHNSCRSQIADALLRLERNAVSIGVASAGIKGGTSVKPGAASVMVELGVPNLSEYSSNGIDEFKPEDFDVVISCCGCGSKLTNEYANWRKQTMFEDWNLDDPPKTDPGDLSEYKRVRDQ